MKVSVIVCSHNPRDDHLTRCLQALCAQTLPGQDWELLLVDNASQPPLGNRVDLSWHPHARCLHQPRLGLTHTRLSGIAAARAPLLIFVDDDNLLAPTYLEAAIRIAGHWPQLGVWGGQALPEFEVPPPGWTQPYLSMLALRSVPRTVWTKSYARAWEAMPFGAGMCVRRTVAEAYASSAADKPMRVDLGRRGATLTSCDDCDLGWLALDEGFALGLFPELSLLHLIKASRLERDYLLKLKEANGYSHVLLARLHQNLPRPRRGSLFSRLLGRVRALTQTPTQRTFNSAYGRGVARALQTIAGGQFGSQGNQPIPLPGAPVGSTHCHSAEAV